MYEKNIKILLKIRPRKQGNLQNYLLLVRKETNYQLVNDVGIIKTYTLKQGSYHYTYNT